MSNSFDIFDLEAIFNIDLGNLDQKYRAIQALVHPDRFIGKTEAERHAAADHAIKVNEAYQRLKNPLHRAEDLLKAKGIDIPGQGGQTIQHPTLLMQVMAWREELDDVQKIEDLDLLVLPGGPDVDATRYLGKKDKVSFANQKPDPMREWFDLNMLPQYIESKIPIFGIKNGRSHSTVM